MGAVSGLCRWRMRKGIRKSYPLGRRCTKRYETIFIGNDYTWWRLPQIGNSQLRQIFGYNVDREAGEKVLASTFDYGEVFEKATHVICHEVAVIWEIVPKNSIEDIVRKGYWEVFWENAKEETSFLESGLHFSHYKAGVGLPLISHLHAMKFLVMLKMGFGY
jgi:hypothetical protein